ncbi:hypothetical protein EDD85DRAFT_921054 [Armillaria nabsnona]|nr:hypothetical protein EDD85DRAFT_921054 [Armillaria nabsnona]
MASTGLFAASYDNISIASRSAEQIIGQNATQENGTYATLFPLWKASLKDIRVTDLEVAFDRAPPLHITDILHSPELFKSDLAGTQPESAIKIEAHKTELFPCQTWPIDESTIIGKEGGYTGYGWCILPNAGVRNPGSLSFHNPVLNRLPITATSLPTFRVLHCFLRISGKKTLVEYLNSIKTWDELVVHATQIQDMFTDTDMVKELCDERQSNMGGKTGDMVYENAVLYMRDALITQEDIVLQNWLVNTTGRSNAFVEVDLIQEDMNFWIKPMEATRHGNCIPCVDILRHLTKSLNAVLGTNQGIKLAPLDFIAASMKNLKEHQVYTIKRERVLNNDDPPIKDFISVGLKELTDSASNLLREYNKEFSRLQARRRLIPVVPLASEIDVVSLHEAVEPTNLDMHAVGPENTATDAPPQSNDVETDAARASGVTEEQPQIDKSTGLQNSCPADSESDSSEEDDEERGKEKGELECLLEDEVELTLGRETSDDVSLNIDGDEEEDEDLDDVQSDSDDSKTE